MQTGNGPFEETIDASASGLAQRPANKCRVDLVEGSGAGLTSETNDVLRTRLRAASVVLLIVFSTFLVWQLVLNPLRSQTGTLLFLANSAVTVVLGLCVANLCRDCPQSRSHLRIKEMVIFGLPALFFLYYQFVHTEWCAYEHRVLPDLAGPWLMLMFTYAMFIPNNWPRAALIVGSMAAATLTLKALMISFHPVCAVALNADWQSFAQLFLIMTVGAVTATIGVHTIGQLRREAFAAKQLGQYRLGERLGAGGMGEVFLAEHQLMKRPCAIKVIRPDKAGDPRVLARFEREVQATARLSHWNSVEVFDYGRTDDGAFYYVMEYLPGMSLSQLIDHGPLPPSRVIYLIRQVCDGLLEAHQMGLIHRDIKPANIFAAQRGGQFDVAKLLDFGMVKPIVQLESVQITQEGSITGSPLYMAPEQATGSKPDPRSDIYALGAVAYHLLTGKPPFDGGNPMKVLLAQVQESPVAPSELIPDVSPELEAVVLRCLAKNPDERFDDTIEMAHALDNCPESGDWTAADAAEWWRQLDGAPDPETPPTPVPEPIPLGSVNVV